MSNQKTYQNTLLLIDGNSLVNRAFYAMPPLNNAQGVPTQAVYGFATMLFRAINDYKPRFVAVAFDLPKPTFRHIKYSQYKATRKKMPDELVVQMPILKEMLKNMGICILEKEGYEADDILGTVAKSASEEGVKTYIITGDRDAYQLITNNVSVLITKRGLSDIIEFTPDVLKQEVGLLAEQIIDYKALCGDSSDNIPGVAGVGEKTALGLLNEYITLEGVYSNIEKITGKLKERLVNDKDNAFLSRELATIDVTVPLEYSVCDSSFNLPFSSDVKQFFIENGFKSLLKRDELFESGGQQIVALAVKKEIAKHKISSVEDLKAKLNEVNGGALAVHFGDNISLSFESGVEYEIELAKTLLDIGLDFTSVIGVIKDLLEDEATEKIVFDAKKTLNLLTTFGIEFNNFFDVKLAQYLVDMSLPLEKIGDLLLAYDFDNTAVATGLFDLATELKKQLANQEMTSLYYDIELPLVRVLFNIEKEGFKVDKQKLVKMGEEFSVKIAELSKEIQEIADKEFNVNSPKQLGEVLFEHLKIPYPKKDKKFSTAVEILELLENDYPICSKVLAYRKLAKLNSTYVEGLLRASSASGVVHTEFKQALTTTGRLSSVEPNLQNIPTRDEMGREIRKAFVPKSGDRVLICADYSQIELRLMAHFSGDPIMIEAYKNNEDIHAETAAKVFGVSIDNVDSDMRRSAKAVNFGIIYGISGFGLANQLKVGNFTAKRYIDNYFEKFSGVKAYLDGAVANAKKLGYAKTLFGRRRRIPELLSSNAGLRNFGERAAMNLPLQGTAADIIKIAMIKVSEVLRGTSGKIILQVHDEIIVEVDKFEAEAVSKKVKEVMEKSTELNVPLVVDINIGGSWYEAK